MTYDNLDTLLLGKIDLDEAKDLIQKAGREGGPTGVHRLASGMADIQHVANRRNRLQLAGVPIPQGLERLESLMLEHVLALAAQEIAEEQAKEKQKSQDGGDAENLGEESLHPVPTVKKSLNVQGKSGGVVSKAWQSADGVPGEEGRMLCSRIFNMIDAPHNEKTGTKKHEGWPPDLPQAYVNRSLEHEYKPAKKGKKKKEVDVGEKEEVETGVA